LARRLGFRFLDTGAMYRAVALAALRRRVDVEDPQQVANLVANIQITWHDQRLILDGQDVTDQLRSNDVTRVIGHVADNAAVREHLARLQRQVAEHGNLVTEGRDQGTVVFPEAQCKIFLTASPEERARRRWQEMERRGERVSFEALLAQQNARDQQDRDRPVGRLVAAPDAVPVSTDGRTVEQVLDQLETLVRRCTA
jgi:cytidylate kinase